MMYGMILMPTLSQAVALLVGLPVNTEKIETKLMNVSKIREEDTKWNVVYRWN